jgi:hypothetical protein
MTKAFIASLPSTSPFELAQYGKHGQLVCYVAGAQPDRPTLRLVVAEPRHGVRSLAEPAMVPDLTAYIDVGRERSPGRVPARGSRPTAKEAAVRFPSEPDMPFGHFKKAHPFVLRFGPDPTRQGGTS